MDIVLFLASILFIVVILTVTFIRGKDKATNNNGFVRSRTLVGISSVFVIIFAVMFAFGAMGHLGIPMNSICFMVCFIVAGVGVDDMIVVENFYSKAIDKKIPEGERMGSAMQHGGLAIFLTSSSSVLAFLSGTGLDMPGVVQFCYTGAFCFFWVSKYHMSSSSCCYA